jgi:hypothetical protein
MAEDRAKRREKARREQKRAQEAREGAVRDETTSEPASEAGHGPSFAETGGVHVVRVRRPA